MRKLLQSFVLLFLFFSLTVETARTEDILSFTRTRDVIYGRPGIRAARFIPPGQARRLANLASYSWTRP